MEIKKAGLTLLTGAIGTKVGGTLFRFILINSLEPEIYGRFAIFLILFNWFLLFTTLNITIGLAKFVSEKRKRRKIFYKAALFGCIVISLIVSFVLILLSPYISSFLNINDASILVFLAIALPFAVFYNITIFYFRGLYRMKASAVSDISLAAIRIFALLFFFWIGYNYAPYMAFLFSFVAIDLALSFFCRIKFMTKGNTKKITGPLKLLILYSLPIFIAEFLRFLSLGFDRLFLAKFFSTFASGIYDVGITLCLGYTLIASSYGMALLPVASKNQKNYKKLRRNLRKTSVYVLILYIIYSILLLLVARPVIEFINPKYVAVIEFLPYLMIAYILIGLLSLFSHFVNAIGLQKYAIVASLLFAVIGFSLNFYLVPQLRYLGAASSIFISAALSLVIISLLVWRKFR